MSSTTTTKDTPLPSLLQHKSLNNQWNFVNISAPTQKQNGAIRKLVRAQAMRDFRRKQRQAQILSRGVAKSREYSDPRLGPAPGTIVAPPTFDSENREREASLASIDISLTLVEPVVSPQTLLNACTSDPFNVYPACNDLRGHRLLSHCRYSGSILPTIFNSKPPERERSCERRSTFSIIKSFSKSILNSFPQSYPRLSPPSSRSILPGV